jgi:hypothetical protein
MVAAFMQLELHERGIHVVCAQWWDGERHVP